MKDKRTPLLTGWTPEKHGQMVADRVNEQRGEDVVVAEPAGEYSLMEAPKTSEWSCYLFGGDHMGIVYTPRAGQEPNWFWRKMQFLCFGHRWVKK